MSFNKDLKKFHPRKEQSDTLNFINKEYIKNPLNKFYLLDLPVGIGKSHLALMIINWYKENINKTAKADIITNTKILQDQYTNTYTSISDLKGKENYECKTYACSCASGIEFNKLNKTTCDDCPYTEAKDSYISSDISLTNFYLYILNNIYNTRISESRKPNILIVDECHEFDDVISDFISIKITEKIIKKYSFTNEYDLIKKLNNIKNIKGYVDFLSYLYKTMTQTVSQMEDSLNSADRSKVSDNRDLLISKILKSTNKDVSIMKLITDIKQYQSKIDFFLKEYKINENNWVLETTYNEKTEQNELSMEPIWANDYLDRYVFSKYEMVFLMSGTILNKKMFCDLNGLDPNLAVYYSIPSPFNVKNRPIYYLPVGKMSFAKKENTFKKFIPYINKLLTKYKDKKGIIHTNSFELSKWIEDSIKNPRLIFHDSSNKDEVLKYHKNTDIPTVLVSPSMDTGVSFDDDLARFQIIAKIPYPSLASKKNKLRQQNNPKWYAWKTSASLQQTCGRIIRSNEDYGDTIIIDESFSDLIRWQSDLMPEWFQDAIITINSKK